MTNIIIKADRQVLNALTWYTRRWVKKHKEKKHAIDLMIQWELVVLWALIVWAIVIPATLYVAEGKALGAAIHVTFWSALAVMEWFSMQMTMRKMKPLHDYVFSMRKNADFVAAHRQMLEKLFVESRSKRLKTTAFMVGITALLLIAFTFVTTAGDPQQLVWPYLLASSLSGGLKRYLFFVDDMSQPKKKKKAAEAISELVARLWGEVTGGFVPKPAFVKI